MTIVGMHVHCENSVSLVDTLLLKVPALPLSGMNHAVVA